MSNKIHITYCQKMRKMALAPKITTTRMQTSKSIFNRE